MSEELEQSRRSIAAYAKAHDVDELERALEALTEAEPDETDPAARNKVLEGWLGLIAAINRDLDPSFDPEDRPLSAVSPPAENGMRMPPGVDPELIKDPQKRREYEAAIAANEAKTARYATQRSLFQVNRSAVAAARTFIRGRYAPEEQAAARQSVAKAGLPEGVVGQILGQ
jgi:hypothetical protein